jgi:hypothetical protein
MKSQVLGLKMSEIWRGLITDSIGHLLRFSTPTQSHDFTNHSNGYSCSKTALVQSYGNEFSFLLVTHTTYFDIWFDRYEILKSVFHTNQVLDRLVYRCLVRFLGHKMNETCWGQNTRSENHFLSFPTPTQRHVSDAHSHSYGHFSTATCGVSSLLENWVIERVEASA